jgi:hypothetical protein
MGVTIFVVKSLIDYYRMLLWRGPIPVAAQSKDLVCNCSLTGIVVSNPAGGMDVCLLWVLCVVSWKSLRRAGPSSRGVLPRVAYLKKVCDREASKNEAV